MVNYHADFKYTAAVYEFYSLHPRRVVYINFCLVYNEFCK